MHTNRTRKVATFNKLPSGNWRAQVRQKGRYVSETFKRRRDDEQRLDVSEAMIHVAMGRVYCAASAIGTILKRILSPGIELERN